MRTPRRRGTAVVLRRVICLRRVSKPTVADGHWHANCLNQVERRPSCGAVVGLCSICSLLICTREGLRHDDGWTAFFKRPSETDAQPWYAEVDR